MNIGINLSIDDIKKQNNNLDLLDIDILLKFVLKKPRSFLYANSDYILNEEQNKKLKRLIQQRKKGKPIAYIISEKEFYGLKFKVDKNTLIPRPETELIIDTVLKTHNNKKENLKILELGTGTGCIAITLAKLYPKSTIVATDNSLSVIKLCHKNIKLHNVSNITTIHSNWFANIPLQKFDLIISNPPYVSLKDKNLMNNETLYEPPNALFSDDNGLADLKKIISVASSFLQGYIILEHGYNHSSKIRAELAKYNYQKITSIKDASSIDRVTIAFFNHG
ncbi:MAG: peptide chain release factor N(5)-glutamine methyltransferase [Gammaproteobacteria bacterium]|nr:MAG: peptide chain release factor N(5)-glutamine methyltransferase [Gammaproteobacteria bacterium]